MKQWNPVSKTFCKDFSSPDCFPKTRPRASVAFLCRPRTARLTSGQLRGRWTGCLRAPALPLHAGLLFSPAGKRAPQCYPSSVSSARTVMLFNLGSAYCLRSEYDKARKCLHQVRPGRAGCLVEQLAGAWNCWALSSCLPSDFWSVC